MSKKYFVYIVLAICALGLSGLFVTPKQVQAVGWTPHVPSLDFGANAMTMIGTDLYVGGSFSSAGGVASTGLSKLDTLTGAWTQIGTFTPAGSVKALVAVGSDLYIGGSFTDVSGVSASNVVKYNTTTSTFSALGGGLSSASVGMSTSVSALAYLNSNLYIGGFFDQAGGVSGANYIVYWSTVTNDYHFMGIGMDADVFALRASGNSVYAGGVFTTVNGVPTPGVAVWSDTTQTWSGLASGMTAGNYVSSLELVGTKIYAGGDFTQMGGVASANIAVYDIVALSWSGVGGSANAMVNSLSAAGTDVFVGGAFTSIGGGSFNRIAKFDTTTSGWSGLGSGVDDGSVQSIYAQSSPSRVYVGGTFNNINSGTSSINFAHYDNPTTVTPSISSFSPALAATNVSKATTLGLTFNVPVTAQAGNITIYKYSDDSVVQTIAANSAAVSVSGTSVAITPPSALTNGVQYYILIDPAAFINASDSTPYPGISTKATWNFTTIASVSFHNLTQTVSESAGVVNLVLDYASAGGPATSFQVSVTGGAATDTFDFTVRTASVSTTTTPTTLTIPLTIIDDSTPESSETINLTLGSFANLEAGTSPSTTITITDNDTVVAGGGGGGSSIISYTSVTSAGVTGGSDSPQAHAPELIVSKDKSIPSVTESASSSPKNTTSNSTTTVTNLSGSKTNSDKTLSCSFLLPKTLSYNAKKNPYLVRQLQVFLNQLLGTSEPETGIYNKTTVALVKKFQANQSLKQTGAWSNLEYEKGSSLICKK